MRQRDPEELRARIERIPLKERRIAWSKAIYGTFSPEEMAESGRRIAQGVRHLEAALSERAWVAGATYSLADIAGFNMLAGLPLMNPQVANDTVTPHILEWLRKINERPAIRRSFALGRTELVRRYAHLDRNAAPAAGGQHA